MKKVYCVFKNSGDEALWKIFDSKEKAEKYVKECSYFLTFRIEEREVEF